MKKTFSLLFVAAAAAGFLTACASHDTGAQRPVNTTVNNLEDSAQFVLFDKGAQESVTCDAIQQQRLPDGRLQVAANIRNRDNRRIQVQVNCVFKDGQGFVVEDTPFKNLFLDEHAQEGVQFVSLNDKAQRYTIRVREAR
ncbi:MAG TPA: YcfL family protein [Candidatus Limnocylindrales bacterium]|jgi:hypothetical protein|nr:YcfL family protein [Candidatus Limnocylindrales bacterium]